MTVVTPGLLESFKSAEFWEIHRSPLAAGLSSQAFRHRRLTVLNESFLRGLSPMSSSRSSPFEVCERTDSCLLTGLVHSLLLSCWQATRHWLTQSLQRVEVDIASEKPKCTLFSGQNHVVTTVLQSRDELQFDYLLLPQLDSVSVCVRVSVCFQQLA